MTLLPLTDEQTNALALRLDALVYDARQVLGMTEREAVTLSQAKNLQKSMLAVFDLLNPPIRVEEAKLERAKYEKAVR